MSANSSVNMNDDASKCLVIFLSLAINVTVFSMNLITDLFKSHVSVMYH